MSADASTIETNIVTPIFREFAGERPKPSSVLYPRSEGTSAVAEAASLLKSSASGTATVSELVTKVPRKVASTTPLRGVIAAHSFEKARHDRIQLLARKYGGKIDAEGEARLAIVTARMSRLNPRITPSQIRRLEDLQDVTAEIGDALAALRSRFGV